MIQKDYRYFFKDELSGERSWSYISSSNVGQKKIGMHKFSRKKRQIVRSNDKVRNRDMDTKSSPIQKTEL